MANISNTHQKSFAGEFGFTIIKCFKFDGNGFIIETLKSQNMQFLLVAYDGIDAGAQNRRLKIRQEHLDKIEKLKETGEFLFGGAILNDKGQMIGSMIVYDFPDRASLDKKLKDEPYIYGRVWEKIEIRPFRHAMIR